MKWAQISHHQIHALPQAPGQLPEHGYLWLDINLSDTTDWVPQIEALANIKLDELHLDDLANPLHPCHFDPGEGYQIMIFRTKVNKPLFDSDHRLSIKTRPCYFVVTDKLLVSIRPADSRTFERAQAYIAGNREQALQPDQTHSSVGNFLGFKRLPDSPTELMMQIGSNIVDRYLETRTELSDTLDRWQRDLLNPRKRFQNWNALLAARNELNRLEATLQDQIDALTEWEQKFATAHAIEGHLLVTVNDTQEHLERMVNLCKRLASSNEAAVQLHFSATAHKTNELITLLTMLTAIFMPLTLIAGLFGMNFENMPLLGEPEGFWISLGLMLGSGALSLLIIMWVKGRSKA